MSKHKSTWHSARLGREISLVRWGEMGVPVLFFPTAAADAEECERFWMVDTLAPLLADRVIKLYSVDSVAGKAWLAEDDSARAAARVQNQFDAAVYHEVVPAIRQDCRDEGIEILACGPSIGAFNALAATLRHPDAFRAAICMSGTYDLSKFIRGELPRELHECSPLHFVPHLAPQGEQLRALRGRRVILAHGEGRWEEPAQSWRVAEVLGAKGIPNRVDSWGPEYDHDWSTWREMLPKYLEELV